MNSNYIKVRFNLIFANLKLKDFDDLIALSLALMLYSLLVNLSAKLV